MLFRSQIRSNAGIWPSSEVSGSAPTPRGGRVSPRSKSLEISTCHPSPGMCSLTNLFAMKSGMDHLLFFFSKQESSCTERNGGKLPLTQPAVLRPKEREVSLGRGWEVLRGRGTQAPGTHHSHPHLYPQPLMLFLGRPGRCLPGMWTPSYNSWFHLTSVESKHVVSRPARRRTPAAPAQMPP